MPFVATFASFLGLLCCEQIRMDVAYCAQPVRLIGHHTGISLGFYGTSHHATEDIGTMRSIADLTIVSPCRRPAARGGDPCVCRLATSRSTSASAAGAIPSSTTNGTMFEFGKAIEHGQGEELTIIACGMPVHARAGSCRDAQCRRAARSASSTWHRSSRSTARPFCAAAARSQALMTVEEHNVLGGLGSAVAEVLADEGAGVKLRAARHP